ncbi:MAG: 1-aminocyclopropane-1-carboxylate deaminase/D-cysteine desulfhydrase [Bacteroidota bacterium]
MKAREIVLFFALVKIKKVLVYLPTPVQEIRVGMLEKAGIQLLVKREDLNHPTVSGNKWWKLKYNLEEVKRQGHTTLLTFGGAYSNHIYATAAAAKASRLNSIGIIRGGKVVPLNPTLSFAEQQAMRLHFVSREDYRKKNDTGFIQNLKEQFGDFYMIPEGGTNMLALKGCAEFATTELSSISFDRLYLPVGTGGTMAGLICGFKGQKEIVGVSVLKDGGFLIANIDHQVQQFSGTSYENWSVLTAYHHGGYAKVTNELLAFIHQTASAHSLPLDPVYTGKLLWAIMKEVEEGNVKRGTAILALHTGGLQGASKLLEDR